METVVQLTRKDLERIWSSPWRSPRTLGAIGVVFGLWTTVALGFAMPERLDSIPVCAVVLFVQSVSIALAAFLVGVSGTRTKARKLPDGSLDLAASSFRIEEEGLRAVGAEHESFLRWTAFDAPVEEHGFLFLPLRGSDRRVTFPIDRTPPEFLAAVRAKIPPAP